ncbi:conserved hypothetical protein [Roseibium sp. TrichSKD4]|uniref:hypothetical protein n=1 Tax=Roseibium sp. TrichSKD4 TaxID=744980 RepID=UPI0001E56C9A|nr:hypothetical protein [Roseibium sp. TrichSKD4]EFO33210.1 conserved hypothetical protein [Roseibium sp. TrichSKD4]
MDFALMPDGSAAYEGKARDILGADASNDQIVEKAEELREQFPNAAQETHLRARISDHIYAHYSAEKQAQDAKWAESYRTKLVAAGVPSLEATVFGIIAAGKDFDSACASVVNALDAEVLGKVQGKTKTERKAYATAMLVKLVKVGIRTEWAESCIRTAMAQAAKGEEIAFPQYPVI